MSMKALRSWQENFSTADRIHMRTCRLIRLDRETWGERQAWIALPDREKARISALADERQAVIDRPRWRELLANLHKAITLGTEAK